LEKGTEERNIDQEEGSILKNPGRKLPDGSDWQRILRKKNEGACDREIKEGELETKSWKS